MNDRGATAAQPPPARLLVDGVDVGPCLVADTPVRRLRGLLGRRTVDGGMLLLSCTSVHGAGMVMALDVALLDADLTVLHVKRLPPFGLVLPRRGVRHVLEAQRGAFGRWRLRPGSRIAVLGLLLFLAGCSSSPLSVPSDSNPAFRATASPSAGLLPLGSAPRDYRGVPGEGFTIQAPSAFQSATQKSSNGEPMLVLRRPSSVSELPASVAVLREPNPKQDVVEQSYALEVSKRTVAKASGVSRSDVTWPGAQRAVLVEWTENVAIGQGRTVATRYVQLSVQVDASLNLAVVAFAPMADADSSAVVTVLRTFRPAGA